VLPAGSVLQELFGLCHALLAAASGATLQHRQATAPGLAAAGAGQCSQHNSLPSDEWPDACVEHYGLWRRSVHRPSQQGLHQGHLSCCSGHPVVLGPQPGQPRLNWQSQLADPAVVLRVSEAGECGW
jgi:hypothetical protein